MSTRGEPQQDRSRITRQSLIEATIDSLAEVGLANTTVVAVAARAGVSRGAAQHHFPSREDLVRATCNHMSDEIAVQMRDLEHEIEDRTDRPLAVLEMLTDLWASRFGRAATQLWVAAATEPSLRELVLSLERKLNKDMYAATVQLLAADPEQPHVRESVQLTMHMARGVGLGSLLRHDVGRRRAELAQWAAMLGGALGGIPL